MNKWILQALGFMVSEWSSPTRIFWNRGCLPTQKPQGCFLYNWYTYAHAHKHRHTNHTHMYSHTEDWKPNRVERSVSHSEHRHYLKSILKIIDITPLRVRPEGVRNICEIRNLVFLNLLPPPASFQAWQAGSHLLKCSDSLEQLLPENRKKKKKSPLPLGVIVRQ